MTGGFCLFPVELLHAITIDGSETKNGKNLIIPLSEPAADALRKAMKVPHIKSPYVFCREDGRAYYSMAVQRSFRKAVEKVGIEDFRFHDLRHCFASWNRQAGVDIDTLAELMGHKDTRMTRRYAHIGPVHLASAVRLLEKSHEEFSTNIRQSNK